MGIEEDKNKWKIDEQLLKSRKLFLYDCNDPETSLKLIRELIFLDEISNEPIYLYLDSPGGHVSNGLGIINVMTHIKSKVITIANTRVCSMATSIFVAGDERWAYKNSVFMIHDMQTGSSGDSKKVITDAEYVKKLYKIKEDHLLKYTKLKRKDLEKARNENLWMFTLEAKRKGMIDKVLK